MECSDVWVSCKNLSQSFINSFAATCVFEGPFANLYFGAERPPTETLLIETKLQIRFNDEFKA